MTTTDKTITSVEQLVAYAINYPEKKFRLTDRQVPYSIATGQPSYAATGADREIRAEYYLDEVTINTWYGNRLYVPAEIATALFPLFPKRFIEKNFGTDRGQTLKRIIKELGVSDFAERANAAQKREQAIRDRNERNYTRQNVAKLAGELAVALAKATAVGVINSVVNDVMMRQLADEMTASIEKTDA